MLTIIVQTYNRHAYMHECLLRLQKYMLEPAEFAWELFIADDGSADPGVVEELTNAKSQWKAKRVFVNPDRGLYGPGKVLNMANDAATGEYIMHIEDDFHLQRAYTKHDLEAAMMAFTSIENLGLIRLRDVWNTNGSSARISEYYNKTHSTEYTFNGMELRVFKPYKEGGTSYQYTGNSHIRLAQVWHEVGAYPEEGTIWHLENAYAERFRKSRFVSGTFKHGWFDHMGVLSTKLLDPRFPKGKEVKYER